MNHEVPVHSAVQLLPRRSLGPALIISITATAILLTFPNPRVQLSKNKLWQHRSREKSESQHVDNSEHFNWQHVKLFVTTTTTARDRFVLFKTTGERESGV
jgi:hypothetical protein